MTPLNISTTNLTSNDLIPNLIAGANGNSDGYLGLGIMLSIFIVLVFTLYRDDLDMRVDILRAVMLSSGFVSILGIIMFASNIITSFVHIMWFIVIFIISFIFVMLQRQKGY
jgi:hypothetical protein